jgi:hypothetical protein
MLPTGGDENPKGFDEATKERRWGMRSMSPKDLERSENQSLLLRHYLTFFVKRVS